jgi:hypothetical protein
MVEVVKVQLPLFSNNPKAKPLVYGYPHRHPRQQTVGKATLKAMGDDVKAYFQADWNEHQNKWIIGKRIVDRSW